MNALALSITSYNTGKQLTKSIYLSYVHTLRLLQNDLRISRTCYNVEQVAAVMCIALLEVSSPTTPGSWLVHIDGVGELIQLSSPDLFSTGIQHKMFIGIRPLIVLQAMLCRKSTFLANEAWIKKPFEFHKQSTLQNLLDLAVTIPGILEEIDALDDQPADTVSTAAKASITQLIKIRMKLESWANDFEAESSTPQYEDPQNQHGTLRYPNLTTANTFTHLWAFQIICMSHIQNLLARFPELSGFGIILSPSALRKSCIRLSMKILQSMKYLIRKEFLLYGRFSVWLPLNMAYHSLNVDQEGIAVLQNLETSAIRDINIEMKTHFRNIKGEWMIRPK
ncbi:hypothetical protein FOYG_14105 [Fusarium oxysporum NRRL 32931]|uniref:Transcription factor domain-containing protein n=1 Tax=Fusarium oxysporum NRRL 32931 TaxID=660029 RepID=W9HNZ9_FUSOX|nr:hypothetical protein FOYG_14105 [Fusarium oxysporum NRRL 32931]